ncbi:acyl-CoA dehydrogenase family protein [Streptomyces solicathayae]|uniref:Acyl-CoA dehydrogenase family protein n=1 Tax=Streptomyces solicathayae TaxID=3081768 RepID=A0ABZ0M1K1_9ACTN|nr:acyl-CoA dehydrogenase family protein [Streptomyces sp. HUAS YS2]WOX24958.1 acyl-CoA dehydrogenase family protein [Streptomyces sp. HUAS YS2]
MGFLLTDEQRDFGRSLDAMLTAADTPAAIRARAGGDAGPARALWARLAEAGVFALAVPEEYEGMGPLPVETAVAFEELGRHAAPGPFAETVASAALLSALAEAGTDAPAKRLLPALAAGETVATLCAGPGPYAADADLADVVLVVDGDRLLLAPGHGAVRESADPARRLARPEEGGELLAAGPAVVAAAERARRWAALATAAQCLGLGRALLDRTVAYTKQRTQFGVPVGSFQAVRHRLADVLIGLEFARPLLHGAALTMTDADVAAAKVTAGEAAYAAARAALQLHGAIGYTEELDLSLWLRKARPLRDTWGTPAECRAIVLAAAPLRRHDDPHDGPLPKGVWGVTVPARSAP